MVDELERVRVSAVATLGAPSFGATMTCTASDGPGYAAELVVLPRAGVAAMDGPWRQLLLPGEELTAIPGDRWSRRRFAADRWHLADPRYALHLVARGCLAATYGEPVFAASDLDLVLDRRVALDLREPGFDASWTDVTGRARVDGFGRTRAVTVRLGAGAAWQSWHWDLRWFDLPLTVDLPPERRVVPQEVWYAEQEEARNR